MKKILLILCFFYSLANTSSAQTIHKVNLKQLLHLVDTSKGPLVVNFWASWCGPCVREIPWFEKNIRNYPGVKLILVSIDFPGEFPKGIADFVKEHQYKSDIYWLNETDIDTFGPQIDKSWNGSIPVTLFVNNRKKYRQFLNQQVPEPRLLVELQKLAGDTN